MNAGGLTMRGKKLIFIDSNGTAREAWGRDDIIFSAQMPDIHPDHDWIWIKPNGNTSITYSNNDVNESNLTSSNWSSKTIAVTSTSNLANGQRHTYNIQFPITNKASANTWSSGYFKIHLYNYNPSSSSGQTIEFTSNRVTDLKGGATAIVTGTIETTTNVASNQTIYIRIEPTTFSSGVDIIGAVQVVASADTTSSRAPCDVYYFP